MANKMLIDATHPEETRVVVVRGSRVEEFDFEAAAKKQLRGNIYLAKVTRVEPSLQAAFVDYGGNRHGFLAFAEIHPDYYQIPFADRQALLEEEARMHSEYDREEPRQRRPQPATARGDFGDSEDAVHSDELTADVEAVEGFAQSLEGEASEAAETQAVAEDFEMTTPVSIEGDIDSLEGLTPVPVYETEDGQLIIDARDVDPSFFEDEDAVEHGEVIDHEDAGSHVEAPYHDDEDEAEDRVDGSNVEEVVEADDDGPEIEEIGGDGSSSEEDQPQPGRGNRRRNGRNRGRGRDRSDRDRGGDRDRERDRSRDEDMDDADQVDVVGSEDALEEVPERRPGPRLRRHYKIQEVIKRRQVLLVQVVKEERGNKGAALTTYLSLAGRYSVLMPNTARGGGISRKITNIQDRKRLKGIAQELEVPEGMGVIVRTAGAARTKLEITRDFEYLLRLWENVRELTLQSTAPKLVYEEGSLIKRSIRDLYNKDIDEVIVAGDDGYREARDFMNMLMPDHTNNVRLYREISPIFTRYGVESQLDAMFSPQVTLRSGGYIVINQTEALVSIDVNSGKSTREHNIEDTALATNLEAAEEVARQLRLRDLAGLVVIDFIDMEEKRNDRSVERRLKDCLKNDRARIQVGRISHFGLLEMSRQRIRSGVLEASMVVCQHCGGTGLVRSTESVALHVLRSIEESLIRGVTHDLIVRTKSSATLYILNQKRAHLADLERRFGLSITVIADDHATANGHLFALERGEPVAQRMAPIAPSTAITQTYEDAYYDDVEEDEDDEESEAQVEEASGRDGRREGGRSQGERSETDSNGRRKRRRRRRGRGRGEGEGNGEGGASGETGAAFGGPAGDFVASEIEGDEGEDEVDETEAGAEGTPSETSDASEAAKAKRRRRGRRGGRRNRRDDEDVTSANGEDESSDDEGSGDEDFEEGTDASESDASDEDPAEDAGEAVTASEDAAPEAEAPDFVVMDRETLTAEVEAQRAADVEAAAKPARKPRARKPRATKAAVEEAAVETVAAQQTSEPSAAEPVADVAAPAVIEPAAEAAPVVVETPAPVVEEAPAPAPAKPEITSTEADPSKPKRAGWWSRKS
jgi:ribonuclease E